MKRGMGNRATIAFATSGFVGAYTTIGGNTRTRGSEQIDDLGNAGGENQYIPHENIEPGERELEVYFPTRVELPDIHGPSQLVTVTYPQRSDETAPAKSAASAFVIETSEPELVNNQVQKAKIKIKYDGMTPRTFTPSTPVI